MGANRGFAAACNRGMAATSGEVVVLLNNDIEADPDFLERLVAPLGRDPRCGMVAPLLLRPGRDSGSTAWESSPTARWPDSARLQGRPAGCGGSSDGCLLGPIGRGRGLPARGSRCRWAGLDEQIFMYGEDLDLALRLRAAGWEAAAALDAMAVHLGAASAGLLLELAARADGLRPRLPAASLGSAPLAGGRPRAPDRGDRRRG